MIGPTPAPPPTTTPLVEAVGVAKHYGPHVALSDASFTVGGGITGLLGANGSGKTTLLGMIIGLHAPTAGHLRVLGRDPWSDGAEVRQYLGYAPEHHTLPADLGAADFVRVVAELHGLPPGEARTRASDALWLVGLGEERFRPMGTMSTGQRQRVKLAQAIAHDPQLVLLDEPTDGLDPLQRDTMLDLIAGIARDFGINIIVSSHLLAEVERVCDAAIIIGEGRTLASGTLGELMVGGGGIHAELDADPAAMQAVAAGLAQRGYVATVHGRKLVVASSRPPSPSPPRSPSPSPSPAGPGERTPSDDDALFNALRDAVIDAGCGLRGLSRSARSLEDVFLDGGTMAQAAPAGPVTPPVEAP